MLFSLLLLLPCSPRHETVYNPLQQLCDRHFDFTRTCHGRKVVAVGYKLLFIKENREEEAEKTSSTCSTNQGYQHFSHLVDCERLTISLTILYFFCACVVANFSDDRHENRLVEIRLKPPRDDFCDDRHKNSPRHMRSY